MPEFLDEKRREIDERLKELKPLFDEYGELQAAAAALDAIDTATPSTRPRSRVAHRAAAAKAAPRRRGDTNGKRGGRPKGTGARATATLGIVRENPGITIAQLAEAMGIKQNYLYRVLPTLAEQGLVTKKGRGWQAKVPA